MDAIISIQTLARAVMAMLLHEPNNAYASPGRVLKKAESYEEVFNEKHDRDMFVACILIQRQVEKYLVSLTAINHVRSVIRYYVSMAVACLLLKKTDRPNPKELAGLLPLAVKPLSEAVLVDVTGLILEIFKRHGESETAAKGPQMLADVLEALKQRLAGPANLV